MDACRKGELEKTAISKLAWNHHHHTNMCEEILMIVQVCTAKFSFSRLWVPNIKMNVKLCLSLSV